MAPARIWVHGVEMTTGDRIEEQSFCYDPDFPPDVAAGLPLSSAAAGAKDPGRTHARPLRRALQACGAALSRRERE
jgi:hypothetical protein